MDSTTDISLIIFSYSSLLKVVKWNSRIRNFLSNIEKIDIKDNAIPPVMIAGGNAGLIKTLGKVLFTDYVLPFEISSILFLSAMVGAVVIGKKD